MADQPSLKDIHRDLIEIREALQDAAMFGRELPRISEDIKTYVGRQTEVVPMRTLATSGLVLRQDIPVVIQAADDGFTATFFDANVSMSGDTKEEAFANLRGMIVDLFLDLDSEPADRLGRGPHLQMQVLNSFIRKA